MFQQNMMADKAIIEKVSKLDEHQISDILTDFLFKMTKNVFLNTQQVQLLMAIIMSGRCPEPLFAAIITAWRMKGENTEEIAAAVSVMRTLANKVKLDVDKVVDIVGTGGDGANLFNVSTAAAFVVSASGANVAKHGSTGVSSRSGASDLLTSAGVNIHLTPEQIMHTLHQQHICFMFAPNHHPAMRHAKNVRSILKIRTIFNILGPLTNPAFVPNTLLGVFHPELCELLSGAMGKLGSRHVWAVCSEDGLDEISLAKPTLVGEFKQGKQTTFMIEPTDVGIEYQSLEGLSISSPQDSLMLIKEALNGKPTDQIRIKKARDIIALNSGAALYLSGVSESFQAGVDLAKQTLSTDKALQKMQDFAMFTQSFA